MYGPYGVVAVRRGDHVATVDQRTAAQVRVLAVALRCTRISRQIGTKLCEYAIWLVTGNGWLILLRRIVLN